MMRICLIGVGLAVLLIMELGTPSRSKPSELDPFEQLKVDVSVSGDTLKKGDRLEVHRLPQEHRFSRRHLPNRYHHGHRT